MLLPLSCARPKAAASRRTPKLHYGTSVLGDVEAAVDAVADVAKAVAIDVQVVELDPILSFRSGRSEETHLLGAVGVRDVVDQHAAIEPGREDQVLADQTARVVLVDVVGPETAAQIEEAVDAPLLQRLR